MADNQEMEPVDENAPKWYRDNMERYKAQVAEKDEKITTLSSQLMQAVVREVGLDISRGPGKAVADFYTGDPDPEQVREFAVQYGWEPPKPVEPGLAGEVREARQRVDQAVAGGRPAETANQADIVKEAEAKGDWVTALRVKTGLVAEELTKQ